MKILVCAIAHLKKSPRANRVVRMLKEEHDVTYLGISNNFDNVSHIPLVATKKFSRKLLRIAAKILRIHSLIGRMQAILEQKKAEDLYVSTWKYE